MARCSLQFAFAVSLSVVLAGTSVAYAGEPVGKAAKPHVSKRLRHSVPQLTLSTKSRVHVPAGASVPIRAIADKLRAWHPYTLGHSRRVSRLAFRIAKEMGISQKERFFIRRGGMVHDIGKLMIPESILEKPGKLTDAEYTQIKDHSQSGYDILMPSLRYRPGGKEIAELARSHHERWDGKGYPLGLAGEKIPLAARVIAVADTFDAMTSQRAYNVPKSVSIALEIIKAESGKQFDPTVVKAFVAMMTKEKSKGSTFVEDRKGSN